MMMLKDLDLDGMMLLDIQMDFGGHYVASFTALGYTADGSRTVLV
jgi:hypothetical protein